MTDATLTRIDLTSSAFEDGKPIPKQHSCDGADQSPPLAWGDPPDGTKSFALVVDDPDAPSGLFRHWAVYDIPASKRSLRAGDKSGSQAINGFGKAGYGGPCPPKGNGAHHYRFKLYALDVDKLNVPPNPDIAAVEDEAQRRAIATGQLVGTFERK